jgi:hypothetical protein
MKNIRVGMRVLVARWGILVGLVGCADGGVPVEDGGDVIDVIDVIDAGNYGSGVGCRVAGVQTCAGGASYGIYVTGISGYGAATNTFPVSGGGGSGSPATPASLRASPATSGASAPKCP